MRFLLIGGSIVFGLLVGCGSQTTQTGATTEEQSPTVTTQDKSQGTNSGAQSRSVTGASIGQESLNDPNSLLSKRSIYYELDSYQVKDDYKPMVQAHARYLSSNRGAKVLIQGNCDERGSREYNLALGQRRAEGVKRMLAILGASENQVEAVSLGEEKPRALGHDESAWAENRRSDMVYQTTK